MLQKRAPWLRAVISRAYLRGRRVVVAALSPAPDRPSPVRTRALQMYGHVLQKRETWLRAVISRACPRAWRRSFAEYRWLLRHVCSRF